MGRLRDERSMEAFRSSLDDRDLLDVGCQWFRWQRGKLPQNNIRERLHRGVARSGWRDLFLNYSLKQCTCSAYDNCPLLLNTFGLDGRQENRYCSFKFEAAWMLEVSCEEEVR